MVDPAVLGTLIFALGGLAGAVFYLPFNRVKQWAWESYWLVYAVVGLIVVPAVLALSTSPNAIPALRNADPKILGYCCLCGAMWGFGGLTWGLMIRYLGVGLGLAIGCGLCAAAGTLIPPVIKGDVGKLYGTTSALIALAGVGVSLLGIILVGMAGMSKENELPEEAKKKAVAEYNFKLGIMVAIFSGLMSAGMNFGLQGGDTIQYKAQFGSATRIVKAGEDKTQAPKELAGATGLFFDKDSDYWVAPANPSEEKLTSKTWRGMPVLVVVLFGGFLVNGLWCLFLNAKNKTFSDYSKAGAPIITNLIFAGLAGAIWCSQFICFKTGESRMGAMAYIGWAVLMASAILFSTVLGILLGEWKGTSSRTRKLLALGLVMLLSSAAVAAYSGYTEKQEAKAKEASSAAAPAGSVGAK